MYMNAHCSVPSPTMRIIELLNLLFLKWKLNVSNWVCLKLLLLFIYLFKFKFILIEG